MKFLTMKIWRPVVLISKATNSYLCIALIVKRSGVYFFTQVPIKYHVTAEENDIKVPVILRRISTNANTRQDKEHMFSFLI